MEIPKLKKIIETTLNENKADNIVSINLKGKSYIADYMIIASGTSNKRLKISPTLSPPLAIQMIWLNLQLS